MIGRAYCYRRGDKEHMSNFCGKPYRNPPPRNTIRNWPNSKTDHTKTDCENMNSMIMKTCSHTSSASTSINMHELM
jgi:hypothetical protein